MNIDIWIIDNKDIGRLWIDLSAGNDVPCSSLVGFFNIGANWPDLDFH